MLVNFPLDQTRPYQLYSLNTTRGITNIGSHPDNDIVIQGPGVTPFHLMLDHRQKPYRVIILNPDAEVRINGVRLAGSDPKEVSDLSGIQFGSFVLQVQPDGNGGSSTSGLPSAHAVQVAVIPAGSPGVSFGNPLAGGDISTPNLQPLIFPNLGLPGALNLTADLSHQSHSDDTILVEVLEPSAATAVDQAAVFHLTIANGGPIVASFEISLDGVPAEWIELLPDRINLYEGARSVVEVRITPPRDPSSQARTYPLRFVITSPNYPAIFGEARAELTVHPYHEFSVGNLVPRSQSIGWGKKYARASFPITNSGNSPATYSLAALDDENSLQFGFAIDEQAIQYKQAEVFVPANSTLDVPLQITPLKRRLVHLRGKQYQFTVTCQPASSAAETGGARMIVGALNSRPLFGFFSILLALALILFGIYQLVIPRISEFTVKEKIIRLGEPALLQWKVSAFTSSLQIPNVSEPFKPSQRQVATIPTGTVTTYTLIAGNWLSGLLGMDIRSSQPVTVLAIPSYPVIDTFSLDRFEIFEGDEITIKWSTQNAQNVLLTIEGVTTALASDSFSGEKVVKVKQDTLVTVEAINNSGSVMRSEYVHAIKPDPSIKYFTITPPTVIKGEPVTVSWSVEGKGIETVMISPFTEALPPTGKLTFFPESSMEFVLTVKSRGDKQLNPLLRSVGVLPQPGAPAVNFFKVVPNKLTSPGSVEISWSVTGETTNIVLNSTDGEIASGLPPQGFKTITISKTTSLMLTAYNGKLSQAASQDIEVTTLKPVKVTILSVAPATSRRVGDSVFVTVDVRPTDKNGVPVDAKSLGYPEVSGKVIVTDGYSSCDFDLPKYGCELVLKKIVRNSVTATYMGDSNYARISSAAYTGLEVIGYPVAITSTITTSGSTTPVTQVVVGEQVMISFKVNSVDAAAKETVTGKITVYNGTEEICSNVNLTANTSNPLEAIGSCPPLFFTTVGQKTLHFHYFDSDTYQPSDHYNNTLHVSSSPVTVTFLSDLSIPTVTGQGFQVQIAVQAASPGSGIPSGSVTITDQDNPTDTCTVKLSAGVATCQSFVMRRVLLDGSGTPTTHSLVASFASDNGSYTAGQAPGLHRVNPAVTTTTLQPSGSSFSFGKAASVTVNLTTKAPGSGTPAGTVTVTLDGAPFCTVMITNGSGSCSGIVGGAGSLAFQAGYGGSTNFQPSSSSPVMVSVSRAATVIEILPDQIYSISAPGGGENVTFNYSVTWANPPISAANQPAGTVELRGNAPGNETQTCAYVYDSSNPVQSCTIHLLVEGERTVAAAFTSSQSTNIAGDTDSITYFVKKSTQISLYGYSTGSTIAGQEVTFSYTVTSQTGETPTGGSVIIQASYPDPSVPGSEITILCQNIPGTNSCLITFPKARSDYRIDYRYTGDNNFYSPVNGTPFAFSVIKADTSITDPVFSRDTLPVDQPFVVSFQVLNLNTNLIPGGTAYLIAHQTPASYCQVPDPAVLTPENQVILNSTTGTASTVRTLTASGIWYFTAYYPGNEDFLASCTNISVTVP